MDGYWEHCACRWRMISPRPSIDWWSMEKLTRSFATEADSGKNNRRLIADWLDCPAPKLAFTRVGNQGLVETPDKASSSMKELFADDGLVANNGASATRRIAVKAKGRVL